MTHRDTPLVAQAAFAKLSGTLTGDTPDAWGTVCPYWRDHVQPTAGCVKCVTTRDDTEEGADAREKYTTQGVNGKGSKPDEKDACCKYSHSTDPRRLATAAMAAFPEKQFTTRQLVPLAKRFMKDNMGAFPLGKPHTDRSKSKLDYQARVHIARTLLSSCCLSQHEHRSASHRPYRRLSLPPMLQTMSMPATPTDLAHTSHRPSYHIGLAAWRRCRSTTMVSLRRR